ncbi:MAG: hypothetical protein R3Y05_00290 [bacterium]
MFEGVKYSIISNPVEIINVLDMVILYTKKIIKNKQLNTIILRLYKMNIPTAISNSIIDAVFGFVKPKVYLTTSPSYIV